MDFFRRQNFDLVGRSWIWFTISGILLVVSIGALAIFGLNLGIDYTGGGLIRYEFAKPLAVTGDQQVQTIGAAGQALEKVGLGHAQVLISGNDQLLIRTPMVENDQAAAEQEKLARGAIEELFGASHGPITPLGRESVGPVVGEQLRQSSLNALLLGCFLILLYITIRYEFRFAVTGVLALVHDVIILLGAMALLQLELDASFVAVILTVIGFSVHDTIIIFDRIRENVKLHRRANFADTVNASLLQTMNRSINTTFTTLLPLIAMAIFATDSIRVFAIGMVIGIVAGTYSSIFNASQLIVVWDTFSARRKSAGAGTVVRRRERARVVGVSAVETAEDEDAEAGEEAAASGSRRLSAQEALARAEETAQEEKRAERRARRKAKSGRGGTKKRF